MATARAEYMKMHVYIVAFYMKMLRDSWGTNYVELMEFGQ